MCLLHSTASFWSRASGFRGDASLLAGVPLEERIGCPERWVGVLRLGLERLEPMEEMTAFYGVRDGTEPESKGRPI